MEHQNDSSSCKYLPASTMGALSSGWQASSEEESGCSPPVPAIAQSLPVNNLYIWISSCDSIKVIIHLAAFIRGLIRLHPALWLISCRSPCCTAAGPARVPHLGWRTAPTAPHVQWVRNKLLAPGSVQTTLTVSKWGRKGTSVLQNTARPYHIPAVPPKCQSLCQFHWGTKRCSDPRYRELPEETTTRQNNAASHLHGLPPKLNMECHLLQGSQLFRKKKKISGLGKLPVLHYAPTAFSFCSLDKWVASEIKSVRGRKGKWQSSNWWSSVWRAALPHTCSVDISVAAHRGCCRGWGHEGQQARGEHM